MFVQVEREDLAETLWEYGEDELSHRVREMTDLELARVGVLAGRILLSSEHATRSGASPTLAKACALAVVEFFDSGRPLARRRRRVRERDDYSWLVPRDWQPPPYGEDSRRVFINACAAIAEDLVEYGFRFAKSGPHVTKRDGELTFRLNFARRSYALEVSAAVRSRRLREWRKRHELDAYDSLAGGQLGNLKREAEWLDWDLTPVGGRERRVNEITTAIREIALPYFEQFEDERSLIECLEDGGIPGCEGLDPVEWLLSSGRREAALRHGRALLARYSWAPRRYQRYVTHYRREGRPRRLHGLVEGLAFATVAYDLDFAA